MHHPVILLEGAMPAETQLLERSLQDAKEEALGKWHCVRGGFCGAEVIVLRTEQGTVNAAASTALALEAFRPDALINQGTSGGHDPALHTGDIVLGIKSHMASAWKSGFAPRGAGADFRDIVPEGTYSRDPQSGAFCQDVFLPGDPLLLEAARQAAEADGGRISEGVISTSDEWNNALDRILFLNKTFGSSVEEMETHAAAMIARTCGVPFLGIRILSNTALYGEPFSPETGSRCQAFVLEVLKRYLRLRGQA